MKKFLSAIAGFLLLFAVCCSPYVEPQLPVAPPEVKEKIEFGEEVQQHALMEIIEAVFTLNPELWHYTLFVTESQFGFAGISCIPSMYSCRLRINVREMQKVHFKYGETVVAFVIAHEIAHIYQFMNGTVEGDSHTLELQADELGACMVKQLKYDTRYVSHFMSEYFEESASHPGVGAREKAFERGLKCE